MRDLADHREKTDRIIIRHLEIPGTAGFSEMSRYLAFISPERRARIEKFRFEKERLTSLFAELLLRMMLSEYMDLTEADIQFCVGEHGKPFLAQRKGAGSGHGADVQFSLSHSGRQVAAAVCRQAVGLDLEILRPGDPGIADRFFLPEEAAYIREAEDRNIAFFRIWTRKEAYIKKTGEGLSRDLRSFSVLEDGPLRNCCLSFQTGSAMISVCADSLSAEKVLFSQTDYREVLAHFDRPESE